VKPWRQTGVLSAGALLAGLVVFSAGLRADVPRLTRLRPSAIPPAQLPPGETIPVLPQLPQASDDSAKGGEEKKADPIESRKEKLKEYSRLEIIRYVHGEFARARRTIPGGKKGFKYTPWKDLEDGEVRKAIASGGIAANPGDQVQITNIAFKGNELWIDINGGGKPKRSFKDRIQVSVGGMPTVQTTQQGGPTGYQGVGSTLILNFGRDLPDMTSAEVKQMLNPFLDFSRQRSATQNWVDTLPPEIQQAIKDHKAVVGMDREMVIAALGRPERKVREKDEDGLETEDWIYGNPPTKTIFVKFAGDRVISVKEFPR
jgi:hypothetical protein